MHRESSSIFVRIILTLILASLPLGLCSCATSGGTANTTSQGNRLETTIKAPVSRIGTTARAVMLDQKMTLVAYSVTETGGRIVGYTPARARIELLIHPIDASSNKVTIVTDGSSAVEDFAAKLLEKVEDKAS